MFLTFKNLTRQFERYIKMSLRRESAVRIIKEDFSATMLSSLLAVAKIGFIMFQISEYFFGKLLKEHYREVFA